MSRIVLVTPTYWPEVRRGTERVVHDLGSTLAARGHEVTLIEQDRETVEQLRREIGSVNLLLGDACEPWVLDEADLASAEVVVAATGDDEDNLVTSLLAKQEFGVPRVLARVNHPKNEWLFDEQWGVDASVSPPHILTAMVEEAVTVGDLVRLLRLEGGKVALVEMRLPEQSPNVGRALYELRLPTDTTLVAILREGHVMIPQPETALAAGDEIVALSSVDSEAGLRDTVMGTGAGAPGAPGTTGDAGSDGAPDA
jgi:trk system potassium uptake protein TrkA